MREEGFYWIKEKHSDWIIAEFVKSGEEGYFRLPCDVFNIVTDNELEEIDEQRIVRR